MVDLLNTIGSALLTAFSSIALLFSGQVYTVPAAVFISGQGETVATSQATSTLALSTASTTIYNTYITQPVIERIVQQAGENSPIFQDSSVFVTQEDLTAKLNALSTTLGRSLYGNSYPAPSTNYGGGGVQNMISLTNKIDQLSGTSLTNITVSGVNGLVNADIPDDITATNYLPIAGGTLTGGLTLTNATTTNFFATTASSTNLFSSNLTIGGTFLTTSGGNVGIGTTSPWAKLSVTNTSSNPSIVVEDSASPDSTPFIVDLSGNVGIGTSTPGSKLHVIGTARLNELEFGAVGAVFGQSRYKISEIGDVLYRADQRFTVVNGTAGMFAGGFGGASVLEQSSTTVISISMAGQSGVPAGGLTYPEGGIYVSFYATTNLYSSISARTRHNGTWVDLGTPANLSTSASFRVMKFTVPSTNYLTDIELTITADATNAVWVSAINYLRDRPDGETEIPYVSKYLSSNSIFGKFGIGTSTPSARLSVTQSTNTNAGGLWIAGTDGDYRAVYMSDTSGTLSFNGGDIAGTLNTASLNSAGAWINASDASYKENVVDFSTKYSLSDITKLEPRFYTMKGTGKPQVGFIAQEVKLVIPELVEGVDGSMGVSYGNMVAVAIQGIKELNTILHEVATRVAGFAERIISREIIVSERICINSTCVTEDQLKSLLKLSENATAFSTTSSTSTATSTATGLGATIDVSVSPADTTAPVITLNGNNPATLEKNASYLDLGAIVTDNVNLNLGYQTTGDQIDTTVPGTYTVTYTATDVAGNTATASRTVIVSDPFVAAPVTETAPAPVDPVPTESVPVTEAVPAPIDPAPVAVEVAP